MGEPVHHHLGLFADIDAGAAQIAAVEHCDVAGVGHVQAHMRVAALGDVDLALAEGEVEMHPFVDHVARHQRAGEEAGQARSDMARHCGQHRFGGDAPARQELVGREPVGRQQPADGAAEPVDRGGEVHQNEPVLALEADMAAARQLFLDHGLRGGAEDVGLDQRTVVVKLGHRHGLDQRVVAEGRGEQGGEFGDRFGLVGGAVDHDAAHRTGGEAAAVEQGAGVRDDDTRLFHRVGREAHVAVDVERQQAGRPGPVAVDHQAGIGHRDAHVPQVLEGDELAGHGVSSSGRSGRGVARLRRGRPGGAVCRRIHRRAACGNVIASGAKARAKSPRGAGRAGERRRGQKKDGDAREEERRRRQNCNRPQGGGRDRCSRIGISDPGLHPLGPGRR